MYATSITSCNAKVSAVSVLLTTLFNFRDYLSRSIYLPSLPSENTRSSSCESPHLTFANEASLKQIKAIFVNDKIVSLDFKIQMNFFGVIMSLTVASLIELLTTLPACTISSLV